MLSLAQTEPEVQPVVLPAAATRRDEPTKGVSFFTMFMFMGLIGVVGYAIGFERGTKGGKEF